MYSFLLVAAGGALGAVARFSMNLAFQRELGLPLGTLTSNLLGCLVMGVIIQLLAGGVPDQYRLMFAVGFCGSFTTLSALIFELNGMLQRNEVLMTFGYLLVTLVGGFACFYLGVVLVRTLLPRVG